MPRERASDYDTKIRLIKDAAAVHFSKTGYTGAKLADIAKTCGVSKSMLYHYFQTKDELLFSMIDEHLDDVLTSFNEVTVRKQTAEEEFTSMLTVLLQQSAKSRQRNLVAMNEVKYLPAELLEKVKEKERSILAVLEKTLRKLNPNLNNASYKSYTLMLTGIINWTDIWFDDKGTLSRQDLVDRVGDLFLNGFLKSTG